MLRRSRWHRLPPPAQGEAPGSQSWLRTGTCRTARRQPGISAGGAWGTRGQGNATRPRAPGEGRRLFWARDPSRELCRTVRIKGQSLNTEGGAAGGRRSHRAPRSWDSQGTKRPQSSPSQTLAQLCDRVGGGTGKAGWAQGEHDWPHG